MSVQKDSKIKFHYSVTIEDGTVVDSTIDENPLEVQLGNNELLPKLEEGLVGMNKGDEKTITLAPEDAFGPVMDEAITDIPRGNIELDESVQEGMFIDLSDEKDQMYRGLVKELNDEFVKIDFNHPLAGKTLTFSVKIEEIL
ncbi:peptidylprolyl isomerase [Deferribacterales bacterium Es71-Z0220]|jgi:FKBP-type peptidyl-prolyl cis-trans isomerase SlpA|uniref:FKBP-type peptidyl-prolyl cis-trans isomerase n=1 Tax=Deferrivibrio essentukiensis TaxID=2880922 RepID=UPI001F61AEB9|nr:peptidylprolyl isomerase [Deferrivibrio essentukiensis]MBZ4672139.1 peptidylprolyl isomerase FKBP-type [Deferribacteraceae bacterium]MCB4204329.1 peptidylprolyl isomerase [Deferrivibrio essentukiensis]